MIPKIIHYVWLGGKDKPKDFYTYLETWKKFLPDYEIMEWNESNFDFSDSVYATESYNAKKYAFTPDYIRAAVLARYGGIYLDTDVEITASFDEMLNESFVTGFENKVYIETAVLASEKGHPFPLMMTEFYKTHHFFKKNGHPDLTPSTPIWTYFLNRYYGMELKCGLQHLIASDNSSVTLFPDDYFAPVNFYTNQLNATENTHAIHHFAYSWAGKKEQTQKKFLDFSYNLLGEKSFAKVTQCYAKHVFKKLKGKETEAISTELKPLAKKKK